MCTTVCEGFVYAASHRPPQTTNKQTYKERNYKLYKVVSNQTSNVERSLAPITYAPWKNAIVVKWKRPLGRRTEEAKNRILLSDDGKSSDLSLWNGSVQQHWGRESTSFEYSSACWGEALLTHRKMRWRKGKRLLENRDSAHYRIVFDCALTIILSLLASKTTRWISIQNYSGFLCFFSCRAVLLLKHFMIHDWLALDNGRRGARWHCAISLCSSRRRSVLQGLTERHDVAHT